ncbi:Ppx/GppA phosphatase family protein [Synoicihabitans lomoniglobus]|uniref:Phosphatase n=1 Tax=Synoicihabitans lomoniglobus TaxID=2909285 RepID=A0AAF0CS57_9BACT|nr:phosphatase [Opitutaceae bacterium LMO-M01]WED67038.1 phosphatase [Opitutaceae bacterium LMO-M01]
MRLARPAIGVIDLGSNSIKALVACRRDDGRLEAIEQRTIDARISAGISHAHPVLSDAGMRAGVEAVVELADMVKAHHPLDIAVVATSAVRDAANGATFAARVTAATGLPLRILSGDEEAQSIGRGLLCDPALADWQSFHVFDLGGGSLECLSFENRRLTRAGSLPLGCVRLSERLIADPAQPLTADEESAVRAFVRDALTAAGIAFPAPLAPAVFCGGTVTTSRSIVAEARNISLAETNPRVTTELLAAILKKLGRMPLDERREVPGLPERRADVMPTALATVLALADYAGFTAFQHSFYNLRWGIADGLLPT